MNKLGSSYDPRKKLRLLKLSLDPTKSTKILRGSHELLTKFLRRPCGRLTKRGFVRSAKKSWTRPSTRLRTYERFTNVLRTLVSYGFLTKILRNGLKIVRTAFVAVRRGICDRALTPKKIARFAISHFRI